MKTLFLIIFMIIPVFITFGQTDTIADNVYIQNGNVGIGTINPSERLHVEGIIFTTDGIRFSDSTVQTTAASSSSSNAYWEDNTSNIFRFAPVSIGRESTDSYFKSKLRVHNGWILVSDSGYNDAGMGVIHLSKGGYGFARSMHQVYDGVIGDPYTEFRVRNNDDQMTVRSWTMGIHHLDENKFKINTFGNVTTGSSPSYGENMLTILTNGYVGIGTSEPTSKLEVNGIIHSDSGGIKFPDGTIQTSAANSSSLSGPIVEIVDGDIFISDIHKGIIMKSPDGQCWRGTLDNSGALNFVAINCEDFNPVSFSNQAEKMSGLFIFPNPAENTVTIAFQNGNLKNMKAVVYTMDGKIVKMETLNNDFSTLKLDDLPQGNYLVKVINKKGREVKSEIIVKH